MRRSTPSSSTHYHLAHTGNNEAFAAAGATIVAHDRTRQWMSVDYWLPDQNRYQKARPKAAWPTEVFFNTGSKTIGGERIEYGYPLAAHAAGDIYVYFKDANVLAVGDVASPVNDPELDWITGAWIGGRVSAMDALLKIGNDQTRVVPGTGPMMTWAEFKAERDLMEAVRAAAVQADSAGRRSSGHGRWRRPEGSAAHVEGSLQVSLRGGGRGSGETTTSWIRMSCRWRRHGIDTVKRLILIIGIMLVAASGPLRSQMQAGQLATVIQEGRRAAALAMIKAGADVNEAQPDGTRPIHWAVDPASTMSWWGTRRLRARPGSIWRTSSATPLASSWSRQGDARMVKMLLGAGAGTEGANADGQTALMAAIKNGDLPIVQTLLDAGARVNVVERSRIRCC